MDHIYAPQAPAQERRAHHWVGFASCKGSEGAAQAFVATGCAPLRRTATRAVGRQQRRREKEVLLALAAGRTGPSGPPSGGQRWRQGERSSQLARASRWGGGSLQEKSPP